MAEFNLEGYKPELISESDFEPINGKGFTANVNSSIIELLEPKNGKDFEPYTRLKYELEIYGASQGKEQFIGRKLWKSFNLDSKDADKKGKTPLNVLADVFFTVGVGTFKNMAELEAVNEKFVNKSVSVSAWAWEDKEKKSVQMHKITGEAKEGNVVTGGVTPF
jgi:hypothetical protein